MMIKNNKGFGGREMLTVSVICLILAAILLVIAIQSSYGEKYNVMKYNAKVFGLSATTYQIENNHDSVYLLELLDNQIFTKVKNPFGGDRYCDPLQSKVEYEDGKKYVTLQCGVYLIDHQYIADEEYAIYKVSPWQKKKPKGEYQKVVTYNYEEKGEPGFLDSEIYEERLFLYAFNKKMASDYQKIAEIPKKYHVYQETLYRTKKLVDIEEETKKG